MQKKYTKMHENVKNVKNVKKYINRAGPGTPGPFSRSDCRPARIGTGWVWKTQSLYNCNTANAFLL